jgi:hypothetical protein
MADYGVAGLENPDFPHCEKGLYDSFCCLKREISWVAIPIGMPTWRLRQI